MARIKIYTKSGCDQCQKLKDYLRLRDLDYEVINLSIKNNRDARKRFREKGYKTLPIIEVDGMVIEGFCEDLLDSIL
jgi:glutaredoxin